MSLWRSEPRPQQRDLAALEIAMRSRGGGTQVASVHVDSDSALRQSAVWAAVRLRADHMSTLPVDIFRDHDGLAVEVNKSSMFESPGGADWSWHEWVWASQSDLDRTGNAVGIIRERNALNLPSRIELANTRETSVRIDKGKVLWRVGREEFAARDIWHERQFPVSGMILGLSPIMYAAWSIGEAMSMQQFALKWFGQGGVPRARLTNTARTIDPADAIEIKERWKSSVEAGDLFVTGNDWEYKLIQAENAGNEFIDGRKLAIPDIARYFGVPADMIDGASSSGAGNVNYANITQKNLMFLVHHLGPGVARREHNWSRGFLPQPRYVKLNTDALLRLDPESRQQIIASKLESFQICMSEARALDNKAPYTPAQMAELKEFHLRPGAEKSTPKTKPDEKKPDKLLPATPE